jgi:hypothetical protein
MLRCRQMPYLHYMDDSENKKLQKKTLLLVSYSFSPSFLCLLMPPERKNQIRDDKLCWNRSIIISLKLAAKKNYPGLSGLGLVN